MMLSKVECMWAMHFLLVPLIVFNLETHAKGMVNKGLGKICFKNKKRKRRWLAFNKGTHK